VLLIKYVQPVNERQEGEIQFFVRQVAAQVTFVALITVENQHCKSRLRESAQGDKWIFCLTAGKIAPRIRREHEQETAPEPCIGL
jgi:hypothetical protein